jgi:DNA-binding Lrp family transcriptional regulator
MLVRTQQSPAFRGRHRRAAACRVRRVYNALYMDLGTVAQSARRPRFRRASEPPAFRLTDDDVEIIRQVARYRLIRSSHIATLVNRSQDRTNDRLLRLFHAGYIDRPRAQLDYYPTAGSAPMVYALADRGVRLLREYDGVTFTNMEWSRKNREAGRPFIEHQIEIVNFQVALERATRDHQDIRLLRTEEMTAASRRPMRLSRDAFMLHAKFSYRGKRYDTRVVPDLVFGLALADGSRRYFMVEIDRGTMPVRRTDHDRTSFEGKMRTYLAAYVGKQHTRQLGWQSFRVLTVTTDRDREHSMQQALRGMHDRRSPGAALFLFCTFDDLRVGNPLINAWRDGNDHSVRLV